MAKKAKTWTAWCGFVDGRPSTAQGPVGYQYGEGLFRSKAKAREGYRDVRKVEIREALK